MRPVKIVAFVLGILLALVGVASVTSAGFLLGVYGTQRDSTGFFTSPDQEVGSYGFALTAPDINSAVGSRWESWLSSRARVTVKITGRSLLPARLFIGVGPTGRVSRYLADAPHDKITHIDWVGGSVEYTHLDGSSPPSSAPAEQSFWVAQSRGSGTQSLEWELEKGDWTVVIMNADGSAPVAATMSLGARFGILAPLVAGLAAGGLLVLGVAATLLILGARRRRQTPPPYPPAPAAGSYR